MKQKDVNEGTFPFDEIKKDDKTAEVQRSGHAEEVKGLEVAKEKDASVKKIELVK